MDGKWLQADYQLEIARKICRRAGGKSGGRKAAPDNVVAGFQALPITQHAHAHICQDQTPSTCAQSKWRCLFVLKYSVFQIDNTVKLQRLQQQALPLSSLLATAAYALFVWIGQHVHPKALHGQFIFRKQIRIQKWCFVFKLKTKKRNLHIISSSKILILIFFLKIDKISAESCADESNSEPQA